MTLAVSIIGWLMAFNIAFFMSKRNELYNLCEDMKRELKDLLYYSHDVWNKTIAIAISKDPLGNELIEPDEVIQISQAARLTIIELKLIELKKRMPELNYNLAPLRTSITIDILTTQLNLKHSKNLDLTIKLVAQLDASYYEQYHNFWLIKLKNNISLKSKLIKNSLMHFTRKIQKILHLK